MKWLIIGVIIVLLIAGIDSSIGDFVKFNARSLGAEGKGMVRCVTSPSAPLCMWSGWASTKAIAAACPMLSCRTVAKQRYAFRRAGPLVIGIAIDVYPDVVGDTWVGDGGTAIHCYDPVDTRGPLQHLLRGPRAPLLDSSPKCAGIDEVAPPRLLDWQTDNR